MGRISRRCETSMRNGVGVEIDMTLGWSAPFETDGGEDTHPSSGDRLGLRLSGCHRLSWRVSIYGTRRTDGQAAEIGVQVVDTNSLGVWAGTMWTRASPHFILCFTRLPCIQGRVRFGNVPCFSPLYVLGNVVFFLSIDYVFGRSVVISVWFGT